jgi:hypothetical protein
MGDTPEVIQLSISNRISCDLGVIVSGWISRVPVEVRAEASSMAESSSVSVISRERDVIPAQGIEWLVFNIDARVECDLLRNALEEWVDLPWKSGEHQLRNREVFYGNREQADAGISA